MNKQPYEKRKRLQKNMCRKQSGYILPMTLLLLSCVLLWGSGLLYMMTNQYSTSDGLVKQEQSRLLAKSGWNLALHQLDTSGSMEDICLEKNSGSVQVTMEPAGSSLVQIVSSADAGDYLRTVEGTVRVLEIPWAETADWVLTEQMDSLEEASIYCSAEHQMLLKESVAVPLAIQGIDNEPVAVTVSEPVSCSVLYIHGDLYVEAALEAEAVYVSGNIYGIEQIASSYITEQCIGETDYRVQVTERIING
ncbi:MAG: hypothetical protein IKZ26_02380 [Peptococcaceae bacterium]|nr:hypothetical protein [Peptococcaceae bacterium]